MDSAVLNYSATPHSYVQRLRQHERAHKLPHEFVFVVNFLVPGTPNFQVCLSFIRNAKFPKVKNGPLAKFDALLDRFLLMSDSERDNCFKFIPRVEEGGWVVKNGESRLLFCLFCCLFSLYAFLSFCEFLLFKSNTSPFFEMVCLLALPIFLFP